MPADGWPQLSLCYKTSRFPPDSTLGQQCAASCACMAASRHAAALGRVFSANAQMISEGRKLLESDPKTVHRLSGWVGHSRCCPCQQKRAARLPSAAPGSIKRGGPETRSGTVQSLKCCPCQQKRAARRSIKGGGPETRSGTVQSLKCCPCQQKRAARLPSAAPGSIKDRVPSRA